MSRYKKIFDKTKYVRFLTKMMNCWKKIIRFGIKSVTALKKDLLMNQCTMKNI